MSQDEANRIAREAQRKRRLSGALKLALPTAAALGAGAAIAVAAIPGTGGTITGCYLTSTANAPNLRIGQLRVIDPSMSPTLPGGGPNPAAVCLSDESMISWSQSGPTGPQGPPGAAGQQGLPGANGQQVLLPAVQFGFDNSAGPMFLKIDGVAGGLTGGAYKGDIEISSFSFGEGSTLGSTGASSGGGAGKTSFSSFTITKPLDKSSAALELGALSAKDFKIEMNGLQPDGRMYLVATNKKTNVEQSVFLEKVKGEATLADCQNTQKERAEQKADYKRENIETRESNGMVILEYTIPEVSGVPIQQRNLFACIPKGDIYVDIHFSKILYKPEDEKLLSDLLNSAQFISKPPKNAP